MLHQDNNGGDQVENGGYEGTEEVSPWPVDELDLGVQVTHVHDVEDCRQDHFHHRQRRVGGRRGTEADQDHQAHYNLGEKEQSLSGAPKVGAGSPAASGREVIGFRHRVNRSPSWV